MPFRRPARGAPATAVILVAAAALGAGCGGGGGSSTTGAAAGANEPGTASTGALRLVDVAAGLDSPVQTVPLPGAGGRLLVVEQAGRVRLVEGGAVAREPVLDISSRVRSGGEQGLLSLALHPGFQTNGLVYIHLSDPAGDTRVEEHRMTGNRIEPEPTRVLLQVDQPYANHNGGSLAFGPDNRLYLGLGDGGSANDPEGNGQNVGNRLGKLLRLDVDRPGAGWEIAAYGLRNPWRFAFDPATGDAWIGDVGQGAWEEVDVFPAGSGLLNFGWDVYEGRDESAADDRSALNPAGTLTPPVAQYGHDEGCSITGGVVVREGGEPALRDRYVFGDYCSGTIWTVPADGDGERELRREDISADGLSSFDAAPDGTVYVTSLAGTVRRVAS